MKPPMMPMMSATTTSSGRVTTPAMMRGATRYFSGLVESVTSASICSVTFMVPISAAMAAETRPAIISPASTGPSSRVMPSATMEETRFSALKREEPIQICSASTPPVKNAVRPMTGSEK